MESWIVEFPVIPASLGNWYLRNTTSTGDQDRATRFPTEEAAREGLLKAKKFLKPAAYKSAIVRRG